MPGAAADLTTVLLSLGGSGALAVLAVKWFGERSIDHAFDRRLEAFKAELERRTGDANAEREYRFEARKRLAAVIGPLRFQLIQSAIFYRDRVTAIATYRYDMRLHRYFGRSTLYRLGRLLAVIELIERQMAYLDFSVDSAMIELMRFRAAVFDALSGGDVLLGHPGADWTQQSEHLFRDEIPVIATAMMTQPQGEALRVVRTDEFNAVLGVGKGIVTYLQPLAGQVARLDLDETPVLWLRLVAVAVLCDGLVANEPLAEALGGDAFDPVQLLDATRDSHVVANRPAFDALLAQLRRPTSVAVTA